MVVWKSLLSAFKCTYEQDWALFCHLKEACEDSTKWWPRTLLRSHISIYLSLSLAHTHACTYKDTHTHTHSPPHTHTHTHTHTYAYTYPSSQQAPSSAGGCLQVSVAFLESLIAQVSRKWLLRMWRANELPERWSVVNWINTGPCYLIKVTHQGKMPQCNEMTNGRWLSRIKWQNHKKGWISFGWGNRTSWQGSPL